MNHTSTSPAYINLDHDIFSKKNESNRLARKVEEFLQATGRSEPVQIPFGRSGYLEYCKENNIDPNQFSLGSQMTAAVEQTFANKKENMPVKPNRKEVVLRERIQDISSEDERLAFNQHARKQAWEAGKTTFIGMCHINQEYVFSIRMNGSNHRCAACISESNKKHKALLGKKDNSGVSKNG